MMRRAVNVKPLGSCLILVRFDTGEEKVFNCFPLMENRLFSRLSDAEFFRTVHIDDMGVVCWDEATDINPYVLYEESEDLSNFAFAG